MRANVRIRYTRRMSTTEPNDVVLPLRLSRSLMERIDALVRAGPRDRSRADVVRDLLALGITHYVPPPVVPEPPRRVVEQARRDARIKDPEWAPELRALHAEGLTNAQICERTGWTEANVRTRMHRLQLKANRR